MSDIFISYARSTEGQAKQIAKALRALGYGVWRDDEIPAHRAYAEVIEERLRSAKAVVVVWSAEAAKSQWVFSEANRAREDGKLVQLSVEATRLPMRFDTIQCADLSGWTGEGEHPNWRRVTASIRELVKTTGGATASSPLAAAPRVSESANAEPLLAVLAFDNLSNDPEMAYFSDGVSEEIQQSVARGADLKVIGRTSSFQYRGADKAVRRVAAELGASHVLDGAVRRSGPRVRISAQLIECARETTLWSDRFDGGLEDVFTLQDEIAAAVAAALKVVFAPAPASTPVDPAAYELYLKARELYDSRFTEPDSIRTAVELLERATTLAPRFARAWADLALVRAYLMSVHGVGESYATARDLVAAAA
jgi:TolB-like protein